MALPENRNDWLTVTAVSVIAMCVVTFDHEALGHGSACFLLHGRILLLSSSLFRCDVRSGWIDPAGPAVNLLMGTVALVCFRVVPARWLTLRLFLVLVTAFSYFWEWGYLIRAMLIRDGDLYYFAEFLLGDVAIWQRWIAIGVGLALYVFTMRTVSNAFRGLWPQARVARTVARTAWFSATLAASIAALTFSGHGWRDLMDSVLEIGGSSFPLLFIPLRDQQTGDSPSSLTRSPITIAVAVILYAVFVACLGRGITS